jgi:2-oxoglutarate ferredoxin oxidoreductase subunit beta
MTTGRAAKKVKNPEYDFKWCPGCGDFGVRRAIEGALQARHIETEMPMENNVVVAGIGCSGNMVHLLEGDQPYGIHGIHGRSLPIALGVKMARPDLNVLVVAGDGDFLSIGMEHIAPQAARNLNITAVVMDNGVYGLTKGQSSPTSKMGAVTSSTPFGKAEVPVDPLRLYLTLGVSYIASAISSDVRGLSARIKEAMEHRGFSIVHVQSPCTTYNNTYEVLKGNAKKGIEPLAWDIPDDHDPEDVDQAYQVLNTPGVPLGLIFRNGRPPLEDVLEEAVKKGRIRTPQEMVDSYTL